MQICFEYFLYLINPLCSRRHGRNQ